MHKIYLSFIVAFLTIIAGCTLDDQTTPLNDNIELINIINLSSFLSEPSGITFNPQSNTLFVVSDTINTIYEVNLSGELINSFPVYAEDLEGICFSAKYDTFYVVEEKKKLITSFDLNGSKLFSFSVDVATSDNSALEGITINKLSNTLYIINEKDPRMILAYAGSTELWRKMIDYTSDISDIYFEEPENCFWVISDESSRILKLNINAALINQWEIPFTKGEGITVVNDKLYVVNDSNAKMYVFQKPE